MTTPQYIESEGDTYDFMREYVFDGAYAPYYSDINYKDKLPKITLNEGTKYEFKVKEYAQNGTSTGRGLYFILRNGETDERIGTKTYLQDKVTKTGDKAEETLYFSGDEYKSIVLEMKLFSFDADSKMRVGVSAVPTEYKVTAGEGVQLIGISSGDFVGNGSTVKYEYNGKTYISNPITAPIEIDSSNAELVGTEEGKPTPTDDPSYDGEISISEQNGQVQALYTVNSNDTGEALDAYIAVYTADGKLISLKKTEVEEGTKELTIELSEGAIYKAFLWDSNMQPVCAYSTYESQGTF